MGSALVAGPHDPAPIADTLSHMRRLRLRTLLAVLVLVTTLPVAAFAGWLISRWSAQQQALIERQNIEQARAILVAVDKEVESTIASLNVLAAIDEIDAADKANFVRIATRILELHPGWHSVRLIDNSLEAVASTSTAQGGSPVLDPAWARQIIQTGRSAVSRVVQDPLTGQWTISIGVPVHPASRSPSVLGAKVYARMFNDVLQRQKVPLDGVVTLLDSTPRVVARTRNQDKYVGQPPTRDFVERIDEAAEGSWRTVLLEGTPAYSAWSRSQVTGLTIGIGLPAAPVDEPLWRSFLALVTAGTAVCGIGLVLALFLGRRLVATQTAAAAAARSLAQGQALPPFDSRIAEAHDLAEGLRDAAGILERRLRERDEAQAEADRHRAARLEQETTARRAAEALNRAKDEFIATVSHELRTPLNVIFGWVAILRSRSLDEAKRTHALEIIERNTKAQVRLIEDLLDMSRAIQGGVRLALESVDIAAVLEAAIDSLRPTAEARRIAITADAPQGVAFAHADPVRLQQVLWNVLSNALKFTPQGGRVTAEVSIDQAEAVVRISDSGEGISPEFLPYVFDRFRQEDAEVTRTHPGLGLGLSLVRHITELHGGTITATSEGKGKGATFTIRLPLRQAAPANDQLRIS
jgi:signal transduction histidine kinase